VGEILEEDGGDGGEVGDSRRQMEEVEANALMRWESNVRAN
jgi:hypothetical protein